MIPLKLPMLGVLLAIATAFCWGTAVIFSRLGLQHIKPTTGVLISTSSSFVLLGILTFITNFDATISLSLAAILWFSLAGFTNYVLGRQLNYRSIRYIGAVRATTIFASAPIFAMIIAVVFTGESVTVPIVIGTLCVVAGLSLLITSR